MESMEAIARKKVIERLNMNNDNEAWRENLTDEEYFYCIGKSFNVLQSHSRYKDDMKKFFMTKSVEVINNNFMQHFKKYSENFFKYHDRDSKEWRIMSLCFSNNPDKVTKESYDFMLLGFLDDSKL